MVQMQCKVSSPDLLRREPREIWVDLNLYPPWRESKKWGEMIPNPWREGGQPTLQIRGRGGAAGDVPEEGRRCMWCWGRGWKEEELQPLFHPEPLYTWAIPHMAGVSGVKWPESPVWAGYSILNREGFFRAGVSGPGRPEYPVQNFQEHQVFKLDKCVRVEACFEDRRKRLGMDKTLKMVDT